ncbi:MAG TPA: AraC family transcriptional regulator [Bryobacteraceae bacterium]|nr:AraC family transcriptional regulator [Bryobacteraceae bacterium]
MLPQLQIAQKHVSAERRRDWQGVAAEILVTSDSRPYDFHFEGPALYLCFGLSGRRKDSVVKVDGEKPTRFVEIANRFHVVPSGARFEGYSVPDTSQRFLQVYLDGQPGALDPEIDLAAISPRLAAADPALLVTARKIEAAILTPEPLGRLYGQTLACVLAIELLEWQRSKSRLFRTHSGGLSPNQAHRVTSFIRDHLADDVSLTALANLAGISPWHFCRAFKRTFGIPPHRWVNSLRVERAKELLACPTLSITDVALATGFAGSSQFARVFRAVTGCSPSEYREQSW